MSRNKQKNRARQAAQPDRAQPPRPEKGWRGRAALPSTPTGRPWLRLLGAVVVVLVVFHSVAGFEFLSWDDPIHVTENIHLRAPWLANIAYFWRTPYEKLYIPVSYTFFAVEAVVSRTFYSDSVSLNPAIFHVGNLLLHCAAVAVVGRLLWKLTSSPQAAAVGALVFGIHPLQAESVAWISETRGVLSALLALGALLQYVNFSTLAEDAAQDSRRPGRAHVRKVWLYYGVATTCYAAALLAKPSAVVAPLMLAAIEIGLLGHRWRRVAIGLAPWAVLAAVITVVTKLEQPSAMLELVPGLMGRLLVAGDTLAFYLTKLVLPINLAVYCRPPEWVLESRWVHVVWLAPAAALAILAVWGRRGPWLVSGLLFLAGVAPVLGLVPFAFQSFSTVGDRYVYLAMLGPALAVAAILVRYKQPAVLGVAAAILLACGVQTHRQLAYWHDSRSLFEHAIDVTKDHYVANLHLGVEDEKAGNYRAALANYDRAVELKPDSFVPWNNRAMLLATAVDPRWRDGSRAVADATRACELNRWKSPDVIDTLAAAYAEKRDFPSAVRWQQEAMRLAAGNPQFLREAQGRLTKYRQSARSGPAAMPGRTRK